MGTYMLDNVMLFDRKQILVKPKKICSTFRFENHPAQLFKKNNKIWRNERSLLIFVVGLTFVAVICVLILFFKNRNSQWFYFITWLVIILTLILAGLFTWKVY